MQSSRLYERTVYCKKQHFYACIPDEYRNSIEKKHSKQLFSQPATLVYEIKQSMHPFYIMHINY